MVLHAHYVGLGVGSHLGVGGSGNGSVSVTGSEDVAGHDDCCTGCR